MVKIKSAPKPLLCLELGLWEGDGIMGALYLNVTLGDRSS